MASKKKQKRPNPPPPPVRSKPPRAASATAGPTKKEQQRSSRAVAERRDALRRKLVTAALLAAVVGAVALYFVLDDRRDAELREALTSGSCEVDTETDPTRPAGQNHVQAPRYGVNPPAGGDHLASAARGGVYSGASVPDEGLLVHSLEHGYVIAWHQPNLPAEQKAVLEEFEQRHDGDVIVAERSNLPVPFAATAWGHRLLCQEVEEAPLERFFDEHVGNGPEDVPRG
ncbi:MAG: hypothetical protein JWM62_2210 [Frankiales bacterium]|jgi:hypothetical protein|nr:hypothetical protein [Frankiales bacterium]